ncbi:ABC transporter ATP-binding protein [Candidatus Woesearchaeota archaeon]|nr:ABC transporter ATP-binding protein [Candidatus Woesearchaeota archaeon]
MNPIAKSLTDNPIIYLANRTWEFSKGNRKRVVIYFILFVLSNIVSLSLPLIIGFVLNIIQEQGITSTNIFLIMAIISGGLILEEVLFWSFHGVARVIERENAFFVKRKYKNYLLEGIMSLPLSWHTDHHSGDTIDKIEKGTNALYTFSEDGFEVIKAVMRLFGSLTVIIYFNANTSITAAVMFTTAVIITLYYDKILKEKYRELNHAENAAAAKVYDALSNITTVIILRIEKVLRKEINDVLMKPLQTFKKMVRLNELKWFLVSMSARILMVLTLGIYILSSYISEKEILVGTIYALYVYADKIGSVFYDFASDYGKIVKQKAAVENAEEIVKHFKKRKKNRKNLELESWREIKIEGLDFSYQDVKDPEKKKHLQDIKLKINRGEKIAFVGESGSGKTTTMKILKSLYTPHRGNITIDGEEGSFEDVSEYATLIPQEPELFNNSIINNITMGVSYSDEIVNNYSKMARFHHVAMRLPRKYQSLIKEKGVNLSGGEKQRLALARGLLAGKDKPIILLDEPTSSVDAKNEHEIYKNIFRNFKDKTIISTVHRLHLLTQFDTIYYFSKGRIVCKGTLEDLLKNEEFKKLWKKYYKTKKKRES